MFCNLKSTEDTFFVDIWICCNNITHRRVDLEIWWCRRRRQTYKPITLPLLMHAHRVITTSMCTKHHSLPHPYTPHPDLSTLTIPSCDTRFRTTSHDLTMFHCFLIITFLWPLLVQLCLCIDWNPCPNMKSATLMCWSANVYIIYVHICTCVWTSNYMYTVVFYSINVVCRLNRMQQIIAFYVRVFKTNFPISISVGHISVPVLPLSCILQESHVTQTHGLPYGSLYPHLFCLITKYYTSFALSWPIYNYKNLNNFGQEWDVDTGLVPFYSSRWSG